MENIKLINKRLTKLYGSVIVGKDRFGGIFKQGDLSRRPTFRLVWSETEYEKRYGTYNVFYGNLFVRTETGTLEMKKYPYVKDRYILERLVHMPNPELPESNAGHYEGVFVFQDKHGNYLKPIWKAIEYACQRLLNAQVAPKNAEMLAGEER